MVELNCNIAFSVHCVLALNSNLQAYNKKVYLESYMYGKTCLLTSETPERTFSAYLLAYAYFPCIHLFDNCVVAHVN